MNSISKTSRKIAIYCRVSTKDQSFDQQIKSCKSFIYMKNWKTDNIELFTEVQSSIKERKIWNDLRYKTLRGEFDTIIVFRLDRAWRSTRQFIMDFDSFKSRNITLVSVMEGFDPTTPLGEAMMIIFIALAELERKNISIATKQRLEALKNLGKKLGRPKGSKDQIKRNTSGYKGNINATKKGGLKKRANL